MSSIKRKLSAVFLFPNGFIAVCGKDGQQVNDLQGEYSVELHKRIMLEADFDTEIKGFHVLPKAFSEIANEFSDYWKPKKMTWDQIKISMEVNDHARQIESILIEGIKNRRLIATFYSEIYDQDINAYDLFYKNNDLKDAFLHDYARFLAQGEDINTSKSIFAEHHRIKPIIKNQVETFMKKNPQYKYFRVYEEDNDFSKKLKRAFEMDM